VSLAGWIRKVIAFGFSVAVVATVLPAFAGPSGACNARKATEFRAAGDRYRDVGRFTDAAHWYLVATQNTRGCRSGEDALLNAHALAQAGSALAQSGDYLRGLTLLNAAQVRLTAIAAFDPRAADAARAYADAVQNMIAAIDRVAQASM
jgi:hypothetical protein